MTTTNNEIEIDEDLENKCEQLFNDVINKMKLLVKTEKDQKSIEFAEHLYKKRCKEKLNLNDFQNLLDQLLNCKEKHFVYFLKIIECLNNVKSTTSQPQKLKLYPCSSDASKTSTVVSNSTSTLTICESASTSSVDLIAAPTPIISSSKKLSQLSESDRRILTNLKKLNEAIHECSKKILECEDAELSLDDLDSENSAYLVEAKLKERFMRLNKEYLKLAKKNPHLVSLVENNDDKEEIVNYGDEELDVIIANYTNIKQIQRERNRIFELNNFDFTRYDDLNEKIRKFFYKNKKFPNYRCICTLVEDANRELGLGLSSDKVAKLAKEVFEAIGKKFKEKREKYDRDCLLSRVDYVSEIFINDPAKTDETLKATLNENRKIAEENYKKIFDDFAVKQEECNEEAPEDENNESDDYETDDGDDEDEDESLESHDIDDVEKNNESNGDLPIERDDTDEIVNNSKPAIKRTFGCIDNDKNINEPCEVITSTTNQITTSEDDDNYLRISNSSIEIKRPRTSNDFIDSLFASAAAATTTTDVHNESIISEVTTTTTTTTVKATNDLTKRFELNEDIKSNLLNRFNRNSSTSSSTSSLSNISSNSRKNISTIFNVTSTTTTPACATTNTVSSSSRSSSSSNRSRNNSGSVNGSHHSGKSTSAQLLFKLLDNNPDEAVKSSNTMAANKNDCSMNDSVIIID